MPQQIEQYTIYNQTERNANQTLTTVPDLDHIWKPFMQQDEYANQYWQRLFTDFPQYQFYICEDNTMLANGRCIPVVWDGDPQTLSPQGWDWALESGFANLAQGIEPNTLCALEIGIAPSQQGKGISRIGIEAMRNIARRQGFQRLIAPVRPSQKHLYPLINMEDYIHWVREDGYAFDAWLRTHQRMGAKIVKVAPEAMRIPGTVSQWEEWSGMQFPGTGQHIVPTALNPVSIDVEANQGLYIEPNVWMVHRVS